MTDEAAEKTSHRILIVDDSPEDRETCRRLLRQCTVHTYEIDECETAMEALQRCMATRPSCVLVDYMLPDGNGLKLLSRLSEQCDDPFLPVIMMTGFGNEQVAVEAMKEGAMDYIAKGRMNVEGVCRTVYKAIEKSALLRIIRRQEEEKDQLIVELRLALEQVKTLRGIIPICAQCKQIRDDKGYWQQVEAYVSTHSEAQFTHGICPNCILELYPTVADGVLKKLRGEG